MTDQADNETGDDHSDIVDEVNDTTMEDHPEIGWQEPPENSRATYRVPDIREVLLPGQGENGADVVVCRRVLMIVEVKPVHDKGDTLKGKDFLPVSEQLRIQAKVAFRVYPEIEELFGIAAFGDRWRWLKWLPNNLDSPFVARDDAAWTADPEERRIESIGAQKMSRVHTLQMPSSDRALANLFKEIWNADGRQL